MTLNTRVKYTESALRRAPCGPGMTAHNYAASVRGTVVQGDDRFVNVLWDGCSRAAHMGAADIEPA